MIEPDDPLSLAEAAQTRITIDPIVFDKLRDLIIGYAREEASMNETECPACGRLIASIPMDRRKIFNARRFAFERAAEIAKNGCLVPPDGGSPTEDERLMCESIARQILAEIEK